MKTFTLVYVDKIKETETGGRQTEINLPIYFEFNGGLGFTVAGINPLTNKIHVEKESIIPFNNGFVTDKPPF